MQDSLPAGGLRLYREGVEPSGSLRKVSGYISILLSRTSPVARAAYANMYAALLIMALLCSGLITLLFRLRDRLLSWQKGLVRW
jgi:hypothetical protein